MITYYAIKPNHDESDSWMHMPSNTSMLSFLPFIKRDRFFRLITREPNRQTEHMI